MSKKKVSLLYYLSKRHAFTFDNKVLIPKHISDYQLLIKTYDKPSNECLKIIKSNGYNNILKIRDINKNPLTLNELINLRRKLQMAFDFFTDPPFMEKSGMNIEVIAQILYNQMDKHELITPILWNTKPDQNKALICDPPDRILSLLKIAHKDVSKSFIADGYSKDELDGLSNIYNIIAAHN